MNLTAEFRQSDGKTATKMRLRTTFFKVLVYPNDTGKKRVDLNNLNSNPAIIHTFIQLSAYE